MAIWACSFCLHRVLAPWPHLFDRLHLVAPLPATFCSPFIAISRMGVFVTGAALSLVGIEPNGSTWQVLTGCMGESYAALLILMRAFTGSFSPPYWLPPASDALMMLFEAS